MLEEVRNCWCVEMVLYWMDLNKFYPQVDV